MLIPSMISLFACQRKIKPMLVSSEATVDGFQLYVIECSARLRLGLEEGLGVEETGNGLCLDER